MSQTYEQWLASREYRIVRSSNSGKTPVKTTLATGLPFEVAKARCKELDKAWRDANPGKSSWTADLHFPELETPPWTPQRA